MALRKLVCLLFGCGRHAAEGTEDEDGLAIVCPRCRRVRVRLLRVRSANGSSNQLTLPTGKPQAVPAETRSVAVRNYLPETILKLGASNRVEAARIARDKSWL